MISKLKKSLEDLNQQMPGWDESVFQILNSNENHDNYENSIELDAFTELLKSLVNQANNNDIPLEDVISLFKDYKCFDFASIYIKRKMQMFSVFKVLRDLEKNDLYKTKFFIDLIWNSYVIRFDPYLEIEKQSPISEKEYVSIASRLYSFSNMCAARRLCESAICKELEEETGLSNEICKYISEKIDCNMNNLKLNFVIDRLASLD